MGNQSRRKGKAGELEFRTFLNARLEEATATRGDQGEGGDKATDVMGVRDYGIEVKRAERPMVGRWWSRLIEDIAGKAVHPVLAWRGNRESWRVVITAAHWCELVNAHRWAKRHGYDGEVEPWDG